MIEILGALTGVQKAFELARLAVEARDDAKAKAAISDMAGLLAQANLAAFALSNQLREVDLELNELKKRLAERGQYSIHEVAPGRFVYRFGAEESGKLQGTPIHHLCQNCFDKGIKSILRLETSASFPRELVCAETASHRIVLD